LFCHHTNWQNATKAGRTNSRTNCQQNRIAISRGYTDSKIVKLVSKQEVIYACAKNNRFG
jgi:hypothetical protein